MKQGDLVFVGDVHGEFDALRGSVRPEDTLVIAGDLLNFMDFSDITRCILYHAFTLDELTLGLKEYAEGKYERVREGIREVSTPGEARYEKIRPLIEDTYESLARSLVCPTYIIFGNDDYPDILMAKLDGAATVIESGIIDVCDKKIGLVSGIPQGERYRNFSGAIPTETFRERIYSLGPVDIVVTHVPPDIQELTYDTIAKRHEPASVDLLDYIRRHAPAFSFFGHVHNPRQRSIQIEKTLVMNLGFFKKTHRSTRITPTTGHIWEQEA